MIVCPSSEGRCSVDPYAYLILIRILCPSALFWMLHGFVLHICVLPFLFESSTRCHDELTLIALLHELEM